MDLRNRIKTYLEKLSDLLSENFWEVRPKYYNLTLNPSIYYVRRTERFLGSREGSL